MCVRNREGGGVRSRSRCTHLCEENALRLHLDDHAVPMILDELLEAQELDGAQLAPVLPVNADLKLAVLRIGEQTAQFNMTTKVFS